MHRLAVVLLCVAACCGAGTQHPLEVLSAHYRIQTVSDPGSATVLVRNGGATPLTIDRLMMDGSPLPAEGIGQGLSPGAGTKRSAAEELAAARIVWARLALNPIPPGGSGLLSVQFRTRPPYAFRLRLIAREKVGAEAQLFPVDTPVRVTNIAFAEDLSECLVYVANASGEKADRVKGVELNGRDVSARLWVSSRELGPGAKELLVIPKPGLRVGETATVVVFLESGATLAERVRALPVFPIALEHGPPAPELGIPDRQDHWPVRTGGPGPAKPGGPPPRFANDAALLRVFHCPSHIMGSDWQGCAAEVLRRTTVAHKRHPRLPVYDALCRARADLASACFAHTTDAGFLNPHLPHYDGSAPAHPVDAVLDGLAMARAANAPDPVYSLVGTYAFGDEKQPPTPDELDRLVHTIIAGGPRGLIYRLRRDKVSLDLAARIRRVNQAVAEFRAHLLVAEPVDWATSSTAQIEPRVLLAGRRALLLVLINRGDKQGHLKPAAGAEATVSLPPWLASAPLVPVGEPVGTTAVVRDGQIRVRIERLATGAVFVFRSK